MNFVSQTTLTHKRTYLFLFFCKTTENSFQGQSLCENVKSQRLFHLLGCSYAFTLNFFYFCMTSLLSPREKGSMGREKGIMGRLCSCSHRLFPFDRFLEHFWQTANMYSRTMRSVYICCYKLSVPFDFHFFPFVS